MNIITDHYTNVIFIGAIMVIEFKEYRKKIKKDTTEFYPFLSKKCLRIHRFSPSEYAIYDSKSWSNERSLINTEK